MKRTDAADHVGNQFQDGNPLTSLDATTVDSSWLNAVQEEIAQAIEGAGLTVDQEQDDVSPTVGDNSQLLKAILQLRKQGGVQLKLTINNNETTPADLTDLIFDKAQVQAVVFDFSIFRKTASDKKKEVGKAFAVYDSEDDDWDIEYQSFIGTGGVVFSINSVGQISYTSDNMSGGSYTGDLRINNIITNKI